MATNTMTVTTQANYIAEIWATDVIEAAQENLVMAELVDRRFEKDMKYGDVLHIPNLSAVTVTDKSADTAISFTNTTENVTDVNINYHKYGAFIVEDIAELQSEIGQRNLYAKRLGYDLGHAIDVILINLLDGFDQTTGTDAMDVTDDDMLTAMVYLDNANAPQTERSIVFSPESIKSLMTLDKYVRLDYHNINGATAVEQSMLNQPMYGAKAYKTTNCKDGSAGHIMGMFHKEALVLIMQRKPQAHVDYLLEYLGYGVAMDAIFGAAEVRDTYGCEILGK